MADVSKLRDDELMKELANDVLVEFLESPRQYKIYDINSKPFNNTIKPRGWTPVVMNNIAGFIQEKLVHLEMDGDVDFAILATKPFGGDYELKSSPPGAQGVPYMVSKFILIKAPQMMLKAS